MSGLQVFQLHGCSHGKLTDDTCGSSMHSRRDYVLDRVCRVHFASLLLTKSKRTVCLVLYGTNSLCSQVVSVAEEVSCACRGQFLLLFHALGCLMRYSECLYAACTQAGFLISWVKLWHVVPCSAYQSSWLVSGQAEPLGL